MALDRKIALRIEANTRKAEADVKRLQGQLNRLSKVKLGARATGQLTTGLARVGQQAKRTSTQMDKLGSRINVALNIAVVLGFTNAIAKAGDSVLNLSNQLKSSGVEAKVLGQNIAFTLRTANATRTSFKSAGVLLARMTRSTQTLGFSMKDVQKATTTVIKGFQLAGATTQEATQSVIQLSQGLASGALRGDELRSVLEGAPVLAQSIAKELKVGVGQLREMGKAGAITSEVVMRALLNDADALDAKFAEMKPTFEGAFEVLKNGLTVAVGETANILGDAIGIKEAFMNAGKALTEAFLDGRVSYAVGELVRDTRMAAAQIKGFFIGLLDKVGLDLPDLTDILAALATLLGVKALRGATKGITAFTPIKADVDAVSRKVDGLGAKLSKGFTAGPLTGITPMSSALDAVSQRVTALRASMGRGFNLGSTGSADGGGLAAPIIVPSAGGSDAVAKNIQRNIDKVAGFNSVVKGYGANTTAFFNGLTQSLEGLNKNLGTAVESTTKLISNQTSVHSEAQTAVNKHQTSVNRLSNQVNKLGRAYDGLAEKDFGTEQERSLARRMDATSERLVSEKKLLVQSTSALEASNKATALLRNAQSGVATGLKADFKGSQALYKGLSTTIKTLTPAMRVALDGVSGAARGMASGFTFASNSIAKSAGAITGSMSTLSGQIGGVATVSMLLPELTITDEAGKFQNSIVEALDSAVEGAFAMFGFEDKKIGTKFASDLLTQVATAIALFAGGAAFFGLIQTAIGGLASVLLGALALPIIAIPATIIAFLATAWVFQKSNLDEKIEAVSSDLTEAFLKFFGVDGKIAKEIGGLVGATLDAIFLPLKAIGIIIDEIINGGTIFTAFERIGAEFSESAKGLKDALKAVFTFENIINFSDVFTALKSDFIAGFLKFFGVGGEVATVIGDTVAVIISPIQLMKLGLKAFDAMDIEICYFIK